MLGFERPGEPLAKALPERLGALVAGLAFRKSMVWEAGGPRFARPVRWLLAKLDSETLPVSLGTLSSGSVSFGHRFTSAGARDPGRGRLSRTAPKRGCRARPGRAAAADRGGARRARRLERSPGEARGGRCTSSRAPSCSKALRRAVPRAAGGRDRDCDAVAPALLPARRKPASRSSRTAAIPRSSAPATRTCSRTGSTTRASPSSATSPAGSRSWPQALGSITFFAGRRELRRQGRAPRPARPRGSAATPTRSRPPGSRRPTRRPSSCASSRTSRARSAPSTRAWPGSRRRSARRSREQYLPDGADAPLPSTEAGRIVSAADKLDTLTVSFELGHRPSGLARPVRPAPRGDRPLPARGRGRGRSRDRRPGGA